MNHDEKVTILWDRYVGALSVTMCQRQITFDALPADTEFLLSGETDADMRPLWLAPEEIDFLTKMIGYVIEKVKISEEAKAALVAVLPRAEALRDEALRAS
ncbi:MAG: hypothetical protein U0556_11970 [Dehalococcoidia bacterium]